MSRPSARKVALWSDVRAALVSLRNQGLIKTDNQGRYIPAREMTQSSAQIMGMCERLAV